MNEKTKTKAIVLRSPVEAKANYLNYRETLRFDFWYSCAYCSISEVEAGGIGFQIDHYWPTTYKPKLKNDYNNLMWSCQICNRYKSGYYPEEDGLSKGNVILRPDEEDPREHLKLEKYSLESKTHKGEFNIHFLDLNRLQLRRLRKIREKLSQSLF